MPIPFNTASLIPLVAKLGGYLQNAFDYAVEMRASNVPFDADTVAGFVTIRMNGWDPKISGRSVLDDATRAAGARFLAGVVFNLVSNRES